MQINHIYKLKGVVQHYDWGGTRFIPQLLGIRGNDKPYAEYWLGAHSSAPSMIEVPGGDAVALNEFINMLPAEVLGSFVQNQFGCLPFLLKVLDVRKMLSIQVHPTKAAAQKEFNRENQEGIDLNAPNRNYKDANHKPELMLALSEFWLLHGFKPREQMLQMFERTPELQALKVIFESGSYRMLYETVMQWNPDQLKSTLQPLIDRIVTQYEGGQLQKNSDDFWAARAAITHKNKEHLDPGILCIYFFNVVHLKPGEAIFQAAGVPHAYLEGQNVEIMANSDNVLRGGLTTKHVDVKELMKHVEFKPTHPDILQGSLLGNHERVYKTACADFELSVIRLDHDSTAIQPSSAEIVLLMQGQAEVTSNGQEVSLKPGEAALLLPNSEIRLSGKQSTLYRATVPRG